MGNKKSFSKLFELIGSAKENGISTEELYNQITEQFKSTANYSETNVRFLMSLTQAYRKSSELPKDITDSDINEVVRRTVHNSQSNMSKANKDALTETAVRDILAKVRTLIPSSPVPVSETVPTEHQKKSSKK